MAQTPKRGLGRGFESLLPADFDREALLLAPEDRIEQIATSSLAPNPNQPRKTFDDAALAELAASIREHGIIQPIIVTPSGSGGYVIIAGERRWRAAQLADLETIPAIVRDHDTLQQLEVALIENVQRVDLNPLEQARSIEQLYQNFSLQYDEIAKRLGKATSTVNNTARLLQLPMVAQEALAAGEISEGHARAILALKGDEERQLYLLNAIKQHGWSVRQAERFVSSVKQGVRETEQASLRTQTETPETKKLSTKIGYPVSIRRTAKGGKLEITFKSDTELDQIMHLFD